MSITSLANKVSNNKYQEINYSTPSGKIILGCALIYIETKLVNLFLFLAIDLTEIRELQKQVETNERLAALGAASIVFANYIRNPLNSISMIVQRLEN